MHCLWLHVTYTLDCSVIHFTFYLLQNSTRPMSIEKGGVVKFPTAASDVLAAVVTPVSGFTQKPEQPGPGTAHACEPATKWMWACVALLWSVWCAYAI